MKRLWIGLLFCFTSAAAPHLKFQGSTTVGPILVEAASIFEKKGWKIFVDTQGGSGGGIAALAENLVEVAMSSKPITSRERQRFPKVDFHSYTIGFDAIGLAVSRPIFEAGVRKISRKQLKGIYESRIRNWKQLGGPDKPIVFYNKEIGRGTWEMFARFLYGSSKKAPLVSHLEVGSNQEARSKVAQHKSAMTALSVSWIEKHPGVHALGIEMDDTSIVFPNKKTIESGKYPLRRALYLITRGPAKKPAQAILDFLRSSEGRKIITKHGFLTIDKLG